MQGATYYSEGIKAQAGRFHSIVTWNLPIWHLVFKGESRWLWLAW